MLGERLLAHLKQRRQLALAERVGGGLAQHVENLQAGGIRQRPHPTRQRQRVGGAQVGGDARLAASVYPPLAGPDHGSRGHASSISTTARLCMTRRRRGPVAQSRTSAPPRRAV